MGVGWARVVGAWGMVGMVARERVGRVMAGAVLVVAA